MIIQIAIPSDADVLIKTGNQIDFTTPLIRKRNEKNVIVPLSKILNIAPDKIFVSLKKVIGENISKGQLLAENKKTFKTHRYFSDVDGKIREINHEDGSVIICVEDAEDETILSFLKGTVVSAKKEKIEVEISKGPQFQIKEVASSFGGEVFRLISDQIVNINEKMIEGKIIMVEKLPSYEQVKLEALGARGTITLDGLEQTPSLPNAKIKNDADWKKIKELKFPYCYVDSTSTIIYFYTD